MPTMLHKSPSGAPGVEHDEIVTLPSATGRVRITCIDYNPGNVLVQEVADMAEFLDDHRPEWSAVRWINVEGLSDLAAIQALAIKYELHPLAVEDLLQEKQRPKVEPYGSGDGDLRPRLFIIVRMLQFRDERLDSEQISMFLGRTTVLTFDGTPGTSGIPSASDSTPPARACATMTRVSSRIHCLTPSSITVFPSWSITASGCRISRTPCSTGRRTGLSTTSTRSNGICWSCVEGSGPCVRWSRPSIASHMHA